MQRLARVNLDQQNASAVELFGHYDEITTILLRHLPPLCWRDLRCMAM